MGRNAAPSAATALRQRQIARRSAGSVSVAAWRSRWRCSDSASGAAASTSASSAFHSSGAARAIHM